MAKLYEKDLLESNINYKLPDKKFVLQPISNRAGIRVRRFGPQNDKKTYLEDARLDQGIPFEQIFQMVQINEEEPAIYQLNYDLTGALYAFLKERKEAGESTDLTDYRLVIDVSKDMSGEFPKYEYTVLKHKVVKKIKPVEQANAELLTEVESLENLYLRNTQEYLSEGHEEKPEKKAKAKSEEPAKVAKKPVAAKDEDEDDDDDLPF